VRARPSGSPAAWSASSAERQPCPKYGSVRRRFDVTLSETLGFDEYPFAKHKGVDADRSLPEKGVVRSEAGMRIGRDGRRVYREVLYDPCSDVARERVIDAATGEVIVDKVESMKQKYLDRGRWQPEDSTSLRRPEAADE
jgi:hypothetical protein